MVAPGSLLWECVRDNNSFLRKSTKTNAPTLSAEPGNLTGENTYRFSGLANPNACDVTVQTTGKKQTIIVNKKVQKQAALAHAPGKFFSKVGLSKKAKKGLTQLNKALMDKMFRPDLQEVAKTKYIKVKRSFTKNKGASNFVKRSKRVSK
mmetsp:Transcript_2889/g.6967  ORF Transcript_2889/g.6967 Transcript_2889/m.6967 type:complete len:150 (+) Transcript_2889:82-531(+)